MKKIILQISAFLILLLFINNRLIARETIPWLKEFTDSVSVGSNTYIYNYTSVKGNECKIRIEEKKINKKGTVTTKAFAFYLNDLDLTTLDFKTSGSNAIVNLEIITKVHCSLYRKRTKRIYT